MSCKSKTSLEAAPKAPDVINGFSFSFCSSLLKKLKELESNNRIFEGENLTDIAKSVTQYLGEQTYYDHVQYANWGSPENVRELIAHAEEFLMIFQS